MLAAQRVAPSALVGLDSRGYFFRPGAGARTVAQVTVPMVVIVPLSSDLTVDIGTRWAYTRLTSYSGAPEDLSGLTDTELRLGYMIGRDAAMASLVASLPTGRRTVSSDKFAVVGALGSDFLTLPVSSYGTGTSLTGGLAAARRLGGLNLGFGASARWSAEYSPFSDQQLTYKPGLETRLQVAGDGLVGSGRLTGGVTYSTFSNDNFTSAGATATVSQAYSPGARIITELSYATRLGNGTVRIFGWDFLRSAGATGGASVADSKENVADVGLNWRVVTSTVVTLTPGTEFRTWSQGGSLAGQQGSLQLTADIAAPAGLQLQTSARADWGFVVNTAAEHVTTQGWGFTFLLRRQL
jgi:hypothetical protein